MLGQQFVYPGNDYRRRQWRLMHTFEETPP
jgi:hypothetical protein